MLSTLQANPSSYIFTENGRTFAKLQNFTGSPAFNFANNMRILAPTPLATFPYDEFRAQVSDDLDEFQVGTSFKSNLLNTFDYMRNIDTQTFAQFEAYFENKLSKIVDPIYGAKLSDKEKFALSQAYYTVLTLTRWAYQHPIPSSVCPPLSREQWIQVAEQAFYSGVGNGARLGGIWAIEGAIATTAAGNPVVGALVGGILGFTTGFIGGAVAGGGLKLMWHCISFKLFSPGMTVMCDNNIYFNYTGAIPSGCLATNSGPLANVGDYAFVPNKGKAAVSTAVLNDINWLLSYI